MNDSFNLKPAREPYEPPRVMRLSDAVKGLGANCQVGSTAQGHCSNGALANANQCTTGGSAGPGVPGAGSGPGF